ncbi:MAG: hypothetical protein KF886_02535 [Candidatus Hydrogenedentes bacterium]|nr:hypothetical protein [Candidatus Hydrogenedentota bacterium]
MKTMHWALLAALGLAACNATAAPIHEITIDGNFDDWADVRAYFDEADDQHDTDHDGEFDIPDYVDHPDVDLLEFKFAHDEENLYAYFRSRGQIGRTSNQADHGRAGRFYIIVTIDVDQDDTTGYPLHEGGYYPTTPGYDMNMEVEFFDGEFNTGHYLLHGCLGDQGSPSFLVSQMEQALGLVSIVPGNYDCYTQWVWYDTPPALNPATHGEPIILPSGEAIYWVVDRGPVYPDSIVTIAISGDGHEAEMKAPFRGFMKDSTTGQPIIALGKKLDLSFSLEASPELVPSDRWGSDTADPIEKYVLGSELAGSNRDRAGHAGDMNDDFRLDSSEILRLIQLYNLGEFHCDPAGEDGFSPGPGDRTCTPHSADYNPEDWNLDLSEMLRAIQIYNWGAYELCDLYGSESEDGLCLPAE